MGSNSALQRQRASPGTQVVIILALSILALSSPAGAATFQFEMAPGLKLDLLLRLSPEVARWTQTGAHSYTGGRYDLTLSQASSGGKKELRIHVQRRDDQSFVVRELQASWQMIRPDIFAAWTYFLDARLHRNYRMLATESFGDVTTANSGVPYAMLVARDGRQLLGVGTLSQDKLTHVNGRPLPLEGLDGNPGYELTMRHLSTARTRDFQESLFTDVSPVQWFAGARRYAQWVDTERDYLPFPIPESAYYPMYDIWYWALDQTSINLYWQTLIKARDLGFQTYLFDSGWESRAGELARWLEGSLGNYSAPANKLPQFAAFLRQVKSSLGMNVVLWMAPYAVGRGSDQYAVSRAQHTLFERARNTFTGGVGPPQTLPLDSRYDENVNLCPRTTGTADYVRRLVDRVMQTYQPDGLWLDFQDMIPFQCEAPHSHPVTFGEGYTATAAAIRDAALSHGAIPTVQVRYPVANLNNKPFANMWQSIDSPNDFDAMRLYNMVMRPFSSGIVMGTDEMYWPPSASTVTAAKFVATTVFSGVPAIGANFDKSPRAHSDVVRAWLDFYKAHREGLTQGRFEPIGDFVRPDQKIESSNQAFVYLRYGATSTLFFRGVSSVFIANSTDTSNLRLELRGLVTGRYLVTVRDIYLRSVSSWNLDVSGGSSLTASVPEGGMVEMLRQF